MRSIVKNTGKLIIAGFAFCLAATNVFANTLSEVEVYKDGTSYGIHLKTEEVAQMKKIASSSDRLAVILKDVSVSENINTIYNNVSKMDNVTIQRMGKNDLKIVFKGRGVSNSKVSFASSRTNVAYPETIQLNAPVSSYAPVYNPETMTVVEEVSQTSNPELNEILTKMHITREMLLTVKKYTKAAAKKAKNMLNGDMNTMTVFGILVLAAVFMLSPRRNKSSVEIKKQKTIGIPARSNIDREIEINKKLVDNMNLKPSLNGTYGVKAYQQSQRNPYMSANNASTNGISGIARRKASTLPPLPSPKHSSSKIVTKDSAPLRTNIQNRAVNSPISAKKPVMQKTEMKKTSTPAKASSKAMSAQSEIDSMKFLESITKIYENSGRTDLAKGLKDNLRKAQLTRV